MTLGISGYIGTIPFSFIKMKGGEIMRAQERFLCTIILLLIIVILIILIKIVPTV